MAPTPAGAINQDLTLNADTTYLIWARVENTGTLGGTGFIWQYSHQAGAFTAITTSSAVVRAVPAATFVDNDDVPQTLLGSGTYVADNNAASEDGTTTLPANFPAGGAIEFVLAFQIRSAAPGIANGQQGQIRLATTGGIPLNSYTTIFDYTVNILTDFAGTPPSRAVTLPTSHAFWGTGEPWSDGTRFSDGQGWLPQTGVAGEVQVQAGSITATGRTPSITSNHFLPVSTGLLTATGRAPSITTTNTFQGIPGTKALSLTPQQPNIGVGSSLVVGSSARTMSRFAPMLSISSVLSAGAGGVALTGRVPTVSTGNKTAATATNVLTLTGQVPTVFAVPDFEIDISYNIVGSAIQNVAIAGSAQVSAVSVLGSGAGLVEISGHAAVGVVSIRGSMTAETLP